MDKESVQKMLIANMEAISFFKEKVQELEKQVNELHEDNRKLKLLIKENHGSLISPSKS